MIVSETSFRIPVTSLIQSYLEGRTQGGGVSGVAGGRIVSSNAESRFSPRVSPTPPGILHSFHPGRVSSIDLYGVDLQLVSVACANHGGDDAAGRRMARVDRAIGAIGFGFEQCRGFLIAGGIELQGLGFGLPGNGAFFCWAAQAASISTPVYVSASPSPERARKRMPSLQRIRMLPPEDSRIS
jgi:hypothetical protein